VPRTLLPFGIAELLARCASLILAWFSGQSRLVTEERVRGILWTVPCRALGLRIGRQVCLDPLPKIALGSGVHLRSGVICEASGSNGFIQIGDDTQIDRNCVLYGQGGLAIGRQCAIAAGVIIYSQTNRYDLASDQLILAQGTRYQRVSIGDDVWIGAGAIILPGVNIADHAAVAAGAVVHRDVEPWQVVGGVPGRVLKDRRCPR
jgi:acetyltransferase-like isoleucine patch superfamily enzyme